MRVTVSESASINNYLRTLSFTLCEDNKTFTGYEYEDSDDRTRYVEYKGSYTQNNNMYLLKSEKGTAFSYTIVFLITVVNDNAAIVVDASAKTHRVIGHGTLE
jgi:hypothetical protein